MLQLWVLNKREKNLMDICEGNETKVGIQRLKMVAALKASVLPSGHTTPVLFCFVIVVKYT